MTMRSVALVIGLAGLVSGCAFGGARGMNEIAARDAAGDPSLIERARVTPAVDERVLLAMYPRDACTGSASAVLVDRTGRFLGTVAPGSAALLRLPKGAHEILTFSSIDVTATDRAEPLVQEVAVPDAPSGIVFRTLRSARGVRCNNGQYMEALVASKAALEGELAETDFTFLEPDTARGQAWLDAHRRRFARILGLAPAPADAFGRARVVFR